MVPTGAYDAGSYKMAQGIIDNSWDILGKKSTKDFIHYMLTDFFFIMPLFFLNTWYYYKKRNRSKQVLFQFFFWNIYFHFDTSGVYRILRREDLE